MFYSGNSIITCDTVPRRLIDEFKAIFNLKESWQNEFRKADFGFTPAEINNEMIKWASERDLVVQSSGYALHLSGKPGGKGVGVRKLLELHGIVREEVAAIGDSKTDIEMFEYATIRGAVANADPALLKVSNVTLKLKSGRGVTEFIDMILR